MPLVTVRSQPVYGLPGSPVSGNVDWALAITPTSNVDYGGSLGLITDGDDTSLGAATDAAMPQYVQVDLGIRRFIWRTRILFGAGNVSATGALLISDDGVTFTPLLSWGSDVTLTRNLVVKAAARYWQIATTAAGAGGAGINIFTWSLFG